MIYRFEPLLFYLVLVGMLAVAAGIVLGVRKRKPEPEPEPEIFDVDIYDIEEIHPNCTVQVLINSVTGKVSTGWWENPEEEWEEF